MSHVTRSLYCSQCGELSQTIYQLRGAAVCLVCAERLLQEWRRFVEESEALLRPTDDHSAPSDHETQGGESTKSQ